ncbi:MAG: flagellar hook assembly protein FlgD [Alphaproteobacteria bacterium]|nr:flagellar hook assembly protein FlgD [Alphaproteobacteria bacterium]MDE2073327.1 flagellar hook assembly protein FlgD [Alphaproteobacteria bacterium]
MTTAIPTTTTPAASSGPVNSTNSTTALNQLSGNFNTFLQLLTTQLQNQDPTSPMDTNQFTQELVQFSQVEQQINTNSNLQTLIGQGQGSATSSAVGYLGKTVTLTNGNAPLANGTANWSYSLGTAAAATTLTVTNSSGKVVYTGNGATTSGLHQFAWNGQDNAGNALPDGTYTLAVNAQDAAGTAVSAQVASSGAVTQVDLTGSTPQLMIGTMSFPISDVSAVAN